MQAITVGNAYKSPLFTIIDPDYNKTHIIIAPAERQRCYDLRTILTTEIESCVPYPKAEKRCLFNLITFCVLRSFDYVFRSTRRWFLRAVTIMSMRIW